MCVWYVCVYGMHACVYVVEKGHHTRILSTISFCSVVNVRAVPSLGCSEFCDDDDVCVACVCRGGT